MKHTILKTIFLYFALAILVTANAHNPGLSFAELRILDDQLQTQVTFSLADIEQIIPLDLNHDNRITSEEMSLEYENLYKLTNDLLLVENNNAQNKSSNFNITLEEKDGLQFSFNVPISSTASQRISIPIIKSLANGHRQYVTVWNETGELLKQSILSSNNNSIVINKESIKSLTSFLTYINEGVWHIWIGYDHILFLLTLLLPAVLAREKDKWNAVRKAQPSINNILKIVTAFTIAHSITLALAIFEIVSFPSNVVETVIAFSVLVAALNNLYPVFNSSRVMLAFIFGLVHGFGFANVLIDLDLPNGSFLSALLGFNVGVEMGQLAIVMLFFPIVFLLREARVYKHWVLNGGSVTAAIIASLWMVERIFDYEILGL